MSPADALRVALSPKSIALIGAPLFAQLTGEPVAWNLSIVSLTASS